MPPSPDIPVDSNPRLARLTPPGRGAVATVVVLGKGADCVVNQTVSFRTDRGATYLRPTLGRIGGADGEEIVVVRKSDGTVFIHSHGGTAAVAAVEEALIQAGAIRAEWQDWVRFISPKSSIAKEASIALPFAPTERTAGILLDQMNGALDREIDTIRAEILDNEPAAALARTETLLGRLPTGLHLREPWHVAIAGRPNVGKSSLINALVGYGRAIVHETPGTTRDVVSAETAFDGFPVTLHDTAGIRDADGHIERSGIERARRRIADSNLVLLVFDGSVPRTEEDIALAGAFPEAVAVYNKADLPLTGPIREGALQVSAVEGLGLPPLIETVVSRLIPCPPPRGAAVPFTLEQGAKLTGVAEALQRGDIEAAVEVLEA